MVSYSLLMEILRKEILLPYVPMFLFLSLTFFKCFFLCVCMFLFVVVVFNSLLLFLAVCTLFVLYCLGLVNSLHRKEMDVFF